MTTATQLLETAAKLQNEALAAADGTTTGTLRAVDLTAAMGAKLTAAAMAYGTEGDLDDAAMCCRLVESWTWDVTLKINRGKA